MSVESRKKLAGQQAELMQALRNDTPLEGFDAHRLHVTAVSLQQKRLRTLERAHPCLTAALGCALDELFAGYCKTHPVPSQGPGADGREFIEYLALEGLLPTQMWRDCLLSIGWKKPMHWWRYLKLWRSASESVNH